LRNRRPVRSAPPAKIGRASLDRPLPPLYYRVSRTLEQRIRRGSGSFVSAVEEFLGEQETVAVVHGVRPFRDGIFGMRPHSDRTRACCSVEETLIEIQSRTRQ